MLDNKAKTDNKIKYVVFLPIRKPTISPTIQKLDKAENKKLKYSETELINANSEKCKATASQPDNFISKDSRSVGKINERI